MVIINITNCGRWLLIFYILLVASIGRVCAKYVEGRLKTLDDWAFLARFCFFSGHGRYEYVIEYERRYGDLQLLLYYDDKSQWPAVYKTGKTCAEKLSVLSVRDNQIVTLSPRPPYNLYSGCTLRTSKSGTSSTTSTTTAGPILNAKPPDPLEPGYFDQFLKTSTPEPSSSPPSSTFDYNVTTDEYFSSVASVNVEGGDDDIDSSTNFKVEDVEEIFTDKAVNTTRRRRRRDISAPYPKLFESERKGTLIVTCHNLGGFTSSRERWWYIAVANCGSKKGLDVHYKFRMTNGLRGDFWHEHFSADEMYIPPILFAETLAYTLMLVAVFLCGLELKSLHLYHCTYRLFTFSAMSQWVGVMFEGVAWAKYALTGLGPHRVLGGFFMGASEISFLLLMLLMAKGYTITRARLSTCSTVKITVYINIYIVFFIALYIYQATAFDPGEVINLYESPAGFALSALRGGAWIAFICSIGSTIRKYPEKGAFYYPFGVLGSMWILGGPLVTLVGVQVLDAWVRESVVTGALGTLAFGGHLAFLWLTWPSRANKSFPYHVRTNHVGVMMSDEDDGLDYPRHPYAPTVPDPNIIIPLSRRTEQLISGVYSDYIRERNYYNSTSNPISHVSFPRPPPSAPTAVSRTSIDSTNSSYPIPQSLHLYKPSETPSTHENQLIDSGHPSMEGSSGSPNSPNSPETPERTSTATTVRSERQTEAKPSSGKSNKSNSSQNLLNNKPNPFLANAKDAGKGPNKIILQPIELPLRGALPPMAATTGNGQQLSRNSDGTVPRHLFAARSMRFDVGGNNDHNHHSPLRTTTSRDDLINRD